MTHLLGGTGYVPSLPATACGVTVRRINTTERVSAVTCPCCLREIARLRALSPPKVTQ
jgi:hypothetical protein